MAEKPTKVDLLEKIRTERAAFEALLDDLGPEKMEEPVVEDGWTVKDFLAHITNWEQLVIDRLREATTGAPGQFPPIRSWEEIHAINSQVYERNKDRPVEAVLEDFHDTHREMMDLLKTLDEDFLTGPLPFEWAEGQPVWTLVGGNTFWHYSEHGEEIEAWRG